MRFLFGVFIAIVQSNFVSALGYVADNFEGILIHDCVLICCRKSAIARFRNGGLQTKFS